MSGVGVPESMYRSVLVDAGLFKRFLKYSFSIAIPMGVYCCQEEV